MTEGGRRWDLGTKLWPSPCSVLAAQCLIYQLGLPYGISLMLFSRKPFIMCWGECVKSDSELSSVCGTTFISFMVELVMVRNKAAAVL
jgi:hypothetical protein